MATATTNTILTQIALKRLSGKALTSGKQSLPQEPFGSTVQSSATTIFGEVVPNTANTDVSDLYIIQSASVSDPGTVQLVDFDLIPLANGKYQNVTDADNDTEESGYNADTGVTTVDTFHAYMLRLTGSYEADTNAIGATYFADNASTSKVLGTDPEFSDNFIASASVQFQVVPEYLSTEVGSSNPYVPVVIASDGSSTIPFTDSSRNMYFDAFSGILFVQDPVDYGTTTDGVDGFDLKSSAATIPGKLRAFLYTGKYQSEVVSGDTVDLHISASEGTGFSLANAATASFESGSAGITVTAGATNTITIGADTDNVTFNTISGSFSGSFEGNGSGLTDIPSSSLSNVVFTNLGDGATQIIEGGLTLTGDITAEQFVVSSSVTYMTQSFSSGSTIFGDSLDDTHQFTGSLFITGVVGNASQIPLVYDATTGEIHTGSAYALSADGMTSFKVSGSLGGFDVTDGDTVSFVSGAGGGLTVTAGATDTVTFTLVGVLSSSAQIATDISGAIDAATSSLSSSLAVDIATNVTNISTNATDITTLEASASAGWYVSASVGGGQSIGLMQTASFLGGDGITVTNNAGEITIESDYGELNSPIFLGTGSDATDASGSSIAYNGTASFTSSGAGLSVDTDGSAGFTYTITPNTVIEAVNTATVINITSSFAQTASFAETASSATVTEDISTATPLGVIFSDLASDNLITDGEVNTGVDLQASYGLVFVPAASSPTLYISSSNDEYTEIAENEIQASGSTNTFNLLTNTTNDVTTINMGVSTGTVFFKGSASIAGDLIVEGTTTTLNTENLLVEDKYILLGSSSAANTTGGGIVVQRGSTTIGTALHWDETKDVWALDINTADASSANAKALNANVAFISHSAGLPGASYDAAVIVGSEDDYKKGQFYVDTSDDYGLYVYL